MKIELKLSADELYYLEQRFAQVGNISLLSFNQQQTDRRLILSILIEVADKLTNMATKLGRKPSLFDTDKKHKVSLKYHEAYAVNVYLTGANNLETDDYKRSMASKLSLIIDQKLQ